MNRIDEKLLKLKNSDKKAFIGFITAGDPTLKDTERLVYALEKSGVDIIELGIPYSDPLADGPIIQRASQRALDNNEFSVEKVMETVSNIRKKSNIPLLFLVYINTILIYGKEKFINKCESIGIDGLIIPDLPLEEKEEILDLISKSNINLIPLVAPTSKDRIEDIVKDSKGFVYCVSSLGVTGGSSNFYNNVYTYLKDVREKSHIPIAVGFGISTKKDIRDFKPYVDGIIVGSAIVKMIETYKGDTEQVKKFVVELVKELKK